MRIPPNQSRIIRETVAEMFGPGARVFLFGSRLDEAARGGDIDLFVEIDQRIAIGRRWPVVSRPSCNSPWAINASTSSWSILRPGPSQFMLRQGITEFHCDQAR